MANIYVRSTDGLDTDDGSTWALAKATLVGALAIATSADTIWVSQNHAETAGAGKAHTFPTTPGLRVLCGNDAAEPPTALATTATVTTTGNTAVTFVSGCAYIYGIIFSSGTGASGAADMVIGSGAPNTALVFDTCALKIPSTSTNAPFVIGVVGGASSTNERTIEFIDCSFTQDASALPSLIELKSGRFIFNNITIAGAGATPPTNLFDIDLAQVIGTALIKNSDLSGRALTNLVEVGSTVAYNIDFVNCKLPSLTAITTGTFNSPNGSHIRMRNCDNADTHIRFSENYWGGVVTQQTSTLIRTGGATQADGTTYSMLMAGNANTVNLHHPLTSPDIAIYNTSVGASMTATVEILRDSLTNLKDDEVWLEIDYLGTTGFPKGSIGSDRITNVLTTAADQAASTVTWDTTGMTNPNKQKLVVTFTPQEAGYVVGRVKLKANTSIYVDPLITLA